MCSSREATADSYVGVAEPSRELVKVTEPAGVSSRQHSVVVGPLLGADALWGLKVVAVGG